jgi:hypothetical protein
MRSSIVAFTALNLGIHLGVGVVFKYEVLIELGVAAYTTPWVRFVPYIMGSITAVNLHESLKAAKVSTRHTFICTFSLSREFFSLVSTVARVALVLGIVHLFPASFSF